MRGRSLGDKAVRLLQTTVVEISMRIKWTSIHRVLEANPAAPWIGPGLAERLKREAAMELAKKKAGDEKRKGFGVVSPEPITPR
jgi:hypothetical protein